MHQIKKIALLNRQGMTAGNDGKIQEALDFLYEALRLSREANQPLHEARVNNNIGLVNQMAGRYQDAETCFREGARLAVEHAGAGNILHRFIVRNLARLEDAREQKATCSGHSADAACSCGAACRA
ncbi:tetratricopeptide repeat protein [Pseudodesulfovibrio sp.]|uniref:tetratricopeptide repeat protein n=1 Tax=unclassified Pseudodesulfovibrio TaxID=2661612 RepID=UPI003B00A5C9